MRLAIVESPFAGKGATERLRDIQTMRNVFYARACVRDSVRKGEAPLASHLLYTQPGILDDKNVDERQLGMRAGWEWMRAMARAQPLEESPIVLFYTDLGWSDGMNEGLARAKDHGLVIEERKIGADWHDSVDAADFDYSYLLEQSITGMCTCGHDAKQHLLMAGTTLDDITTKRLGMCGVPGCCVRFAPDWSNEARGALDDQLREAYDVLKQALDRRTARAGFAPGSTIRTRVEP